MGGERVGEGVWGDKLQTGVEIISEMIGGARTDKVPRYTTQLRATLLVPVTKLGWTLRVCVCVVKCAIFILL